ncbi:unnamed protein product [Allacma fusca]|uniref:Uncharacterized protein n=1 Tax=Allacma fusca TaxID=39272 RepID=A0A8J2NXV3_9HEXA|nr:unnamed protein product [Allacma fusca]
MYDHMRQFPVTNVSEGVAAVRDGKLDALIYDGPVLQYEVLQDANGTCQLLIEGSWYAHTGYGLAFPRHSKYLQLFNKNLMEYKESGDLERLKRFYFTGPCSLAQRDPNNMGSPSAGTSNQLALEQFHSAFLLLVCGIIFACLLLGIEHLYSKCVRRHCVDRPPSCFTLLSQNMGRPFDFPYGSGPIYEPRRFRNGLPVEKYARECKDPFCRTNLLRTEHHLKMALLRCHQLENRLRLYVVDNNRRHATPGLGLSTVPVFDTHTCACRRKRRSKSSSCWPGGTRHQMTFSELSVSAMISPRDFGGRNHIDTSSFTTEALESSSQSMAFKYREHLYRPRLTEIAEIETVL